jgi:hypothetical protein
MVNTTISWQEIQMKIKLSSKPDSNPTKIKHRTMNLDNLPPKQNHYWSVGFAMDPDIGERVRLSVLSIHPTEE